MERETSDSRNLRKYVLTFAAGLLLSATVYLYEGFQQGWNYEVMSFAHRISDAASVSGLLFLSAALMAFVINGGGTDAFAYMGHRFRWMFSKRLREEEAKVPNYYLYVQERRARGKHCVGNLFLVGGVLLVIGIVAAVLY